MGGDRGGGGGGGRNTRPAKRGEVDEGRESNFLHLSVKLYHLGVTERVTGAFTQLWSLVITHCTVS